MCTISINNDKPTAWDILLTHSYKKPLITVCYHPIYSFMYTGSSHVNNSFGFTAKADFGLAVGCNGKTCFRLAVDSIGKAYFVGLGSH